MMDMVGNCITLIINIVCVDAFINAFTSPCLPSLPPRYTPCIPSLETLHSGKQSAPWFYMEQHVLTLAEANAM